MLSNDIARYVELHRSMGFKFRSQHILLRSFGEFAGEHGDRFVRTATVLSWAGQAPSPPQRHNRLATVRRFALAMRAEDPHHEVPPSEAFGRAWFKRRSPHLYSPEQIAALLGAASRLSPRHSIRPITCRTLFALLAVTGLRISEALALEIGDLTEDGLIVRATKFHKSRLVPLHKSTDRALREYLRHRARVATTSPALFISRKGVALPYPTVFRIFLHLARSTGLRAGPGQRGPRIHDLRHTFAVRSLERCTGTAAEVARHAVALSTYLGHTHVSDTYWYLQATPTLMRQIAHLGESLHSGAQP
jgi:integrase